MSEQTVAKKIEFSFPEHPVARQAFFVQDGDYRCIGENYTVRKVTSRSFYIYNRGKLSRYPRTEWKTWLLQRAMEGTLFLDGAKLQIPPHWRADSEGIKRSLSNELPAAIQAVKEGCQLKKISQSDTSTIFELLINEATYELTVSADHSLYPNCSCWLHRQEKTQVLGQMCRHVIALLLLRSELQFHLLDLFLPSMEKNNDQ